MAWSSSPSRMPLPQMGTPRARAQADTAAEKEGSHGTFMAAPHASKRPMSPWAASPVETWKQS